MDWTSWLGSDLQPWCCVWLLRLACKRHVVSSLLFPIGCSSGWGQPPCCEEAQAALWQGLHRKELRPPAIAVWLSYLENNLQVPIIRWLQSHLDSNLIRNPDSESPRILAVTSLEILIQNHPAKLFSDFDLQKLKVINASYFELLDLGVWVTNTLAMHPLASDLPSLGPSFFSWK